MKITTVSELRKNMAAMLDQVVAQDDTLVVHRGGSRDVVVIPLETWTGIQETFALTRTPAEAAELARRAQDMDAGRSMVEYDLTSDDVAGAA